MVEELVKDIRQDGCTLIFHFPVVVGDVQFADGSSHPNKSLLPNWRPSWMLQSNSEAYVVQVS